MNKNVVGFIVVIALLIGGVFAFRAATKPKPIPNPFPTQSRAHLPFEDFVKSLAAIPNFNNKVRNATSGTEATAIGFEISQNGLKRLTDADLSRWMELVVKMVEHLDERTCATVARADPAAARAQSAKLLLALEKMSSDDIRAYFNLTLKAVNAELDRTPAPDFSKEKAERAMRKLVRKFNAEEQAVMMRVSLYPSTASDASACWIVKTMFSEIMDLPAADRQVLSRLFAQPPDARG
ncbi:MAG: hypothetical protein ABI905_15560 [Betaproteobacteria bacterium]